MYVVYHEKGGKSYYKTCRPDTSSGKLAQSRCNKKLMIIYWEGVKNDVILNIFHTNRTESLTRHVCERVKESERDSLKCREKERRTAKIAKRMLHDTYFGRNKLSSSSSLYHHIALLDYSYRESERRIFVKLYNTWFVSHSTDTQKFDETVKKDEKQILCKSNKNKK